MTAEARSQQDSTIKAMRGSGLFSRHLMIPYLWDTDPTLLVHVGEAPALAPGQQARVKASQKLVSLVDRLAANRPTLALRREGMRWLNFLLDCCFPGHTYLFQGPFSVRLLLQTNDYILDKAFVCAAIVASKLLTAERFPQGLYGEWPPPAPSDLRLTVNIFGG